jgi:hypothetical protein
LVTLCNSLAQLLSGTLQVLIKYKIYGNRIHYSKEK